MRGCLKQGIVAAALSVASLAAQACGYTGGAGVEGMFSLDDPLDIAILSVLIGGVCAVVPGLLCRMGLLKPAAG